MDNIVYLMGAGFSAPFGLPVISNFYSKSKDLQKDHPDQYQWFDEVFEEFESLARIMLYFRSNQHDIEEVLSILDMRKRLLGDNKSDVFLRYIKAVIEAFTKEMTPYTSKNLPGNWEGFVFGSDRLNNSLGAFVANMLHLDASEWMIQHDDGQLRSLQMQARANRHANYAVITMNYDCLLENACEFLSRTYHCPLAIRFSEPENAVPWQEPCALVKLHGSTRGAEIVPPTWSKVLHSATDSAWRFAFRLLQAADQIRFIGYSLPLLMRHQLGCSCRRADPTSYAF